MSTHTAEINESWFEIIKLVAIKSAEKEPFLSLLAILATVIILGVAPIWIVAYYKNADTLSKQQKDFRNIRNGTG